jgi:hypothetical protein
VREDCKSERILGGFCEGAGRARACSSLILLLVLPSSSTPFFPLPSLPLIPPAAPHIPTPMTDWHLHQDDSGAFKTPGSSPHNPLEARARRGWQQGGAAAAVREERGIRLDAAPATMAFGAKQAVGWKANPILAPRSRSSSCGNNNTTAIFRHSSRRARVFCEFIPAPPRGGSWSPSFDLLPSSPPHAGKELEALPRSASSPDLVVKRGLVGLRVPR